MADLGNIQYTDVNAGTSVVDRSQEARAIGQTANALKAGADAVLTDMAENKMEAAIDAAQKESERIGELDPYDITDASIPGTEAYMFAKVDRLTAVMEQGSVSMRTKAELELNSIIQNSPRWLRDRIRRRAGDVVAGSKKLMSIGLDDQLRSRNAEVAQSELDTILAHARKKVEDGGLGIDPALSPRDPEFIRQYVLLQGDRNRQQTQAMATAMATVRAQETLNDPVAYAELKTQLQGELSNAAAEWRKMEKLYQLDELNRNVIAGEGGDQAWIDNWVQTVAPEAQVYFTQRANELRNYYRENMPVGGESHPAGARFKQAFDDYITELETLSGILKDAANNVPGAVARIEAHRAIRANDVFNRLDEPFKDGSAFLTSPTGSMIMKLAFESKTPSGITLQDQFNLSSQTGLAQALPNYFNPDHPNYAGNVIANIMNSSPEVLKIPRGASGLEIRSVIADVLQDPNKSFAVPATTNEQMLVAALAKAEQHFAFWDAARNVDKVNSPTYADDTLLGLTYSLTYMNGSLKKPEDVGEEILRMLGSSRLMDAMDVSIAGDQPPGIRNAFGMAAAEWYAATRPDQRRAAAGERFNNYLLGDAVSLSEVVIIDQDAIGRGEFKYSIDDTQLRKLAQSTRVRTTGRTTHQSELGMNYARQLVTEEMNKIIGEMNQQIAISMLINKAQSDGTNFRQDPNDWTDFFLGVDSPTPGSSWANVFAGDFSNVRRGL